MAMGLVYLQTALLILVAAVYGRQYYTAAVYEHAVNYSITEVNSRQDALEVMDIHLRVLEEQVSVAKLQNADIFVFPEYGLYNQLADRKSASFYTEDIPDPSVSTFCPCLNASIPAEMEVLHRLSCLARDNNLYLAVNMADKKPCTKSTDIHCPDNGQYQYNTEVVFDREGCLVARYHKENLFESEKLKWNVPETVEYSYFDTEFGRFGLMICFDAVFRKPAVDLIEKHNVTDIIFSTAWINVFPHYASVAYHSGFARNMKVNYLASNLHDVPKGFVGSGIYGPDGILDYTFNVNSSLGSLVIASVPIIEKNQPASLSLYIEPLDLTSFDPSFELEVFGDKFTFTALDGLSGTAHVYNGEVYCSLYFSRADSTELYAVGAFDGMHYLEGEYYFETCLLVRCTNNYTSCGDVAYNSTPTMFNRYALYGKTATKYVFPEVIAADFNFTTDWSFAQRGGYSVINGTNKRIEAVVLMGRNFDKDPANENSSAVCMKSNNILMIMAALLMTVYASVW